MEREPEEPKPGQERAARPVSAAEEAARKAPPHAVSDEEKSALAAEVSRIEDA